MNEEEIEEFIDQVNGVEREYKHKPILAKNVENIGIAIQSALNLYQKEKEKNKKLEEVIDMIAKDYINNFIYGEYSDDPCEYYYKEINLKEKCKIKHSEDFEECKECLKEYYFNKVKEKENDK